MRETLKLLTPGGKSQNFPPGRMGKMGDALGGNTYQLW
ncbi:MAG: hypothetical protein CM15mP51_10620 [Porticoccaceae bacterium]|nr:MAG: hypothetical protein CM15mP51_10620 [Porticoccaceae bacterium]